MSDHIGIRFKLGEAFPADDSLARWMTITAMALNDLLYVNRLLIPRLQEEVESADYENIYLARLAGAHLFEIAVFLDHAHRRLSAIREFIDGLDRNAKAAYEKIRAVGPKGSGDFAKHLADARGQVFHYSELIPQAEDREELKAAMAEHAESMGEIRDEGAPITGFRARFADDIAAELTFGDRPLDELDYVTQVSEHIAAFLKFAFAAIAHYVQRLPREAWEYIDPDTPPDSHGGLRFA
ncbi:MAG: hypothetical protein U0R52_04300 [Solirubrobacterales bacterium]